LPPASITAVLLTEIAPLTLIDGTIIGPSIAIPPAAEILPSESTRNFETPFSVPLRIVAPDCETLNNPAVPVKASDSPITPTPVPVGDAATPCTPVPPAPEAAPLTPVPIVLEAWPSTPVVLPLGADANPTTPCPDKAADSPRTPTAVPVWEEAWPLIATLVGPDAVAFTPMVPAEVALMAVPVPLWFTKMTSLPLVSEKLIAPADVTPCWTTDGAPLAMLAVLLSSNPPPDCAVPGAGWAPREETAVAKLRPTDC
jgi:hypothetical protein